MAVPPPLFAYLSNRLNNLNAQLNVLDQRLAAERQKQQAAITEAQRLTRQSLSLSRWPLPLTTVTQLAAGRLEVAQLLDHLHRQTTARLAAQEQKLAELRQLQKQASARAAEITTLQQQITKKRSTLKPEQKIALATAAANADQLALSIQTALTPALPAIKSPTLKEESLPASRRLPLNAKPQTTTTGLLFNAASGAPVTSVTAGEVLYAGPFRQYGGLVIIASGPRTQHIYAGLGTLKVKAGDTLDVGETLGQLPTQGPSRLYWEVRQNGRPLPASKLLTL